MIINNGNIQKWFFDYVEGNLSELELQELENFVLKHPEYQADFQAWKDSLKYDEEDKVPAFTGMNSLLVAVPFYETIYFKISAAAILILGFIGTSAYFLNENQKTQTYHSFSGKTNIKELSNITIAKLEPFDFQVFENFKSQFNNQSIPTKIDSESEELFVASHSKQVNNNISNYSNVDQLNFDSKNKSESYNSQNNTFGSDINFEKTDESVFFFENDNLENVSIDVETIDKVFAYDSDLNSDSKSNKNKYAFLDFRNKEGFGIYNNKSKNSKSNKNRETEENLADISEGLVDGDKIKHKTNKKSKFFDKFKYIELGLGNINDPFFALPNNNLVSINPSLSGELGLTRIKTNVRSQWLGSDSEMMQGSLYTDSYFTKIKAGMGWGLDYSNGENGKLQNYRFLYTYSQKFSITKNSNLSLALSYELLSVNAQQSLLGKMIEMRPNQIVSLNNFVSKSGKHISNLGISSWYSGKYFYGGINLTNLMNNSLMASYDNQTTYMENLEYNVQLGTDYKKNMYSNTVISPYVVFQNQQQTNSLWGGITLRHKAFVTGVSINNHIAGKAILGLQGNSIRFLYGYDVSKSQINQSYLASHEVSLRILLGNKHKSNWSRYGN